MMNIYNAIIISLITTHKESCSLVYKELMVLTAYSELWAS